MGEPSEACDGVIIQPTDLSTLVIEPGVEGKATLSGGDVLEPEAAPYGQDNTSQEPVESVYIADPFEVLGIGPT